MNERSVIENDSKEQDFFVLSKLESLLLWRYYHTRYHPFKREIYHWLRNRKKNSRVIMRYGSTGWIILDERDLVQEHIWRLGAFEPEVWDVLSSFAKKDEVFWDIGAHIGSVSIRALCDKRFREVHAFEPDPIPLKALKANIALNDNEPKRAFIHPFGLSDQNEIKTLYHAPFPNTALTSLHKLDEFANKFEIICRTVDTCLENKISIPTMMKIDAEGWETQIFQGARKLLEYHPPKAIIFENKSDPLGNRLQPDAAREIERYGYKITHIKRKKGLYYENENYLAVLES
jgi:FkbM family methyltransferase